MGDESNSLENSEDINYLVLEMHGDIKKIEQHLQEITNSIEANAQNIDSNRQDIDSLEDDVEQVQTKVKVGAALAGVAGGALVAAANLIPALV